MPVRAACHPCIPVDSSLESTHSSLFISAPRSLLTERRTLASSSSPSFPSFYLAVVPFLQLTLFDSRACILSLFWVNLPSLFYSFTANLSANRFRSPSFRSPTVTLRKHQASLHLLSRTIYEDKNDPKHTWLHTLFVIRLYNTFEPLD